MRGFCSLALLGACLCGTSLVHAQTQVLIAASDPTQISEVDVVKVMAADSSLWLSVKLAGQTQLGIVSSLANLEAAPDSDAWLRALDFATRVRVTPPLGPPVSCLGTTGKLADSGLPELPVLRASQVSSVASDSELAQSLAEAGLTVDVTRDARFSADAVAPFRFAVYEAAKMGGSTLAVRLTDTSGALAVPGVAVVGRDFVPLTLLALAPTAVLPATGPVSDPSEFAVSYLGASASTDYAAARNAWLSEDPTRWLVETRASSALFAWTVFPDVGGIEPALAHYLQATPAKGDAETCFATIQAARAKGSQLDGDYMCDGADDLARSLSELNFSDVRVTRLFGTVTSSGLSLRTSDDADRDSRLIATDFDATDCATSAAASTGAGATQPVTVSAPSTGNGSNGVTVSSPDDGSTTDVSASSSSEMSTDDGSGDSCSGDSSSDSSSNDSCSGDSSSDSSSNDSCSGDSSSDSSSKDSCSGDSSSSSDDSSGCGKSNYDGDTCSGNSASSANADAKTSAALEAGSSSGSRRPRKVHLSLWTLLSAALALPLRRRGLLRSLTT